MDADINMQNRCRGDHGVDLALRERHDKDVRYLNSKIEGLEKLMNARFVSQEKARKISSTAIDARFESVNEFRATLSDQTKDFVTREVIESTNKDVERRISEIESRLAGYDGRIIGWSAGIGFLVLVISFVLTIAR